jgi:hypothetical protein
MKEVEENYMPKKTHEEILKSEIAKSKDTFAK